jgi:hypothetical protein
VQNTASRHTPTLSFANCDIVRAGASATRRPGHLCEVAASDGAIAAIPESMPAPEIDRGVIVHLGADRIERYRAEKLPPARVPAMQVPAADELLASGLNCVAPLAEQSAGMSAQFDQVERSGPPLVVPARRLLGFATAVRRSIGFRGILPRYAQLWDARCWPAIARQTTSTCLRNMRRGTRFRSSSTPSRDPRADCPERNARTSLAAAKRADRDPHRSQRQQEVPHSTLNATLNGSAPLYRPERSGFQRRHRP